MSAAATSHQRQAAHGAGPPAGLAWQIGATPSASAEGAALPLGLTACSASSRPHWAPWPAVGVVLMSSRRVCGCGGGTPFGSNS